MKVIHVSKHEELSILHIAPQYMFYGAMLNTE